ncbi:hypothetical protein DVH24_019607 [Malus domestica]|uniref:Uncharacterized protein n=1 Tax=Malus domestica TaxID=3750 RepID=A0A498I1D9_MALDO|nr:hypothetical protein DVH24_019607 [Malus domestica]
MWCFDSKHWNSVIIWQSPERDSENFGRDPKKRLEYLDLTEDMTQNRAQWRSRIHIADPT